MNKLICFGLGYSAGVFARRMLVNGWQVLGTTRDVEAAQSLRDEGFDVSLFTGLEPSMDVSDALKTATHVLISVSPGVSGDAVLAHHAGDLAAAPALQWIGYLSTVGVYGDHGGAWVDEVAILTPKSERSLQRVAAEQAWSEFGDRTGKVVQIFRLAGIYGPGRGSLENVRAGKGRRIIKSGQVFNRIHVEDIASVLEASLAKPKAGAIYNVSDNEPAPPQDVVTFAAKILGIDLPPEVAFEDAELTPMGRSFYGENKRVSNARIREELGVKLAFPTYREGISNQAERLK
jgi:nucleoside-diphosphate-sugar epimerase